MPVGVALDDLGHFLSRAPAIFLGKWSTAGAKSTGAVTALVAATATLQVEKQLARLQQKLRQRWQQRRLLILLWYFSWRDYNRSCDNAGSNDDS